MPGVYHWRSVTKLFTATAIMQLAEDGKFGLDDPVSRYLPAFTTMVKSGELTDITVRQLLDHTSGMKDLAPTALVGWIHHLGDVARTRSTPTTRDQRGSSEPPKTSPVSGRHFFQPASLTATAF